MVIKVRCRIKKEVESNKEDEKVRRRSKTGRHRESSEHNSQKKQDTNISMVGPSKAALMAVKHLICSCCASLKIARMNFVVVSQKCLRAFSTESDWPMKPEIKLHSFAGCLKRQIFASADIDRE